MEQIRLFTGHDPREAIGWAVFAQSVLERCSLPVSITPLRGQGRDGSTAFTYSRFLIPWLCDFRGFAIWADGADMLARADLAELWEMRVDRTAVRVVRRPDYKTRAPLKNVGTRLEAGNRDYPRKNWSSLIVWNCAHYCNRVLTPDYIAEHDGLHLHSFAWVKDDRIGDLPPEWNVLVGEEENERAKIAHFTLGIPSFARYNSQPFAGEWRDVLARMVGGLGT